MLPSAWKATKLLPNVPGTPNIPLIKSDRINSLRKKYDAFLEEDKKRKERNEYILGKLDKMRCCTAVVPVRQKPAAFTETRTANFHNVPKQAVESPSSLPYNDHQNLHLEMPRKHVDEIILQEVSKKYILIPKLRPTCDDYVTGTKPKIDDNTDWKSKYQILEQLKRDEKEQDIPTRDEENMNYRETVIKDDSQTVEYKNEMPDHIQENQLSYDLQSYANDTQEVKQPYYDGNIHETLEIANVEVEKYKNNIENTDVVDNKNGRFANYESNIEYDQVKTIDNTENLDKNVKINGYIDNVDDTISSLELDTVIKNPTNKYSKADESPNNIENVPLESDFSEKPKENKNNQEVNINQKTYLDREEVTLTQDMNAGDLINGINNDLTPESDSNVLANTDYPVETINVQDFTPCEDVKLQDGVNINPEPRVLVDQDDLTYHYDPIVETGTDPTKTLDAEQDHELYNEQPDQNYDYTEEALVENYNPEYTAPNENYEQNEYAYYEGAQTEQANDNEETSQRYDQNYEQQYGTAYNQEGYEQGYVQDPEQPEYTEQMQHYEAPDLDTVQYEENQDNLTPQYVEQQLDNEQGYTEKQDENIEISNVEKTDEKQENFKVDNQQVQ